MSEGPLHGDGWLSESRDVTTAIAALLRRAAARRHRPRQVPVLKLRGSDAAGLVAVSTHRLTVLGTTTGVQKLLLEVTYAARGPAIGMTSDKRFTVTR